MKIRMAVIPPDKLMTVMRLTNNLRKAVNSADMDGVETATKELLLAVTNTTHSVDIDEAEWREFLAELRVRNFAFQSDYVVAGQLCGKFFPEATADMMVLQLPFSEREVGDV